MRQVILIQDLEIRDKLASSNINKFLYLYSSEAMPKQQDANMVSKVDSFFFPKHNSNKNVDSLLPKPPIYDLILI